jgi:hypothetical protein
VSSRQAEAVFSLKKTTLSFGGFPRLSGSSKNFHFIFLSRLHNFHVNLIATLFVDQHFRGGGEETPQISTSKAYTRTSNKQFAWLVSRSKSYVFLNIHQVSDNIP